MRRPVGPPPRVQRLAAMLAIPILLYTLVMTGQKALENYQLAVQADDLRTQVHDLREQNLALQQQVVRAHSDAAIETIAREQLGLVKPGDTPLVLVAPTPATPNPAVKPSAKPGGPPWQQWWNLFSGSGD